MYDLPYKENTLGFIVGLPRTEQNKEHIQRTWLSEFNLVSVQSVEHTRQILTHNSPCLFCACKCHLMFISAVLLLTLYYCSSLPLLPP